jgi:hypothetical protein
MVRAHLGQPKYQQTFLQPSMEPGKCHCKRKYHNRGRMHPGARWGCRSLLQIGRIIPKGGELCILLPPLIPNVVSSSSPDCSVGGAANGDIRFAATRNAAAYYRAFYAIEDKKDSIGSHQLSKRAIGAARCALGFLPGRPVYFASDSRVALELIHGYAGEHNRSIVTNQSPKEILHLDMASRSNVSWNLSEFYDTFVDLWIMGNARCVSYGVGGFSHFVQLLSFDSNCSNRHFTEVKHRSASTKMAKNRSSFLPKLVISYLLPLDI